ncbi:CPBP family intramembrane metalloprotease [Terrimonas sp. NA20]|uniref:CPBP family intramembrane metalloprotease n=1 Tax=Terrimonas ginsenosidimutans TaxID=2908004 RepID=A0ABS9KUJ0_9BACT|nr:type II CAAX endopeptidase family protein [Terrimonas ginsenosidimutans]MCG2615962.1 CPBP family intramembrane metalloprotease [Terrimonas ginsenosidimutans]
MFIVLFRCILFWILFEILLFATGKMAWFAPPEAVRWVQAGFGIASAIVLIYLFLRFEKKSFADIYLRIDRKTPLRFAGGLLAGAIIMSCILAVLLVFSELKLSKTPLTASPLKTASIYLMIIPFAFMEELAFRSYTMVRLDREYGLWTAQFLSAVVFALYHIVSGWTWYIAFMGPFIWAFLFALSAIRSAGIAMPTGIHASLNILQVVLGMKGGEAAFFALKLKEGHTPNAQQKLDALGIAIHIVIFAGGILATWFFIRNRNRSASISDLRE